MSSALASARDTTVVVRHTELASTVDPLAIWASSSDEHRSYFARGDFALVGLGAAAIVEGQTNDLGALTNARAELRDRLDLRVGANPLLLGGAAFGTVSRDRGPAWSNFPASRFVLPELLVIRRGTRVWAVSAGGGSDVSHLADLEPISAAALHGLPPIDADHDDDYLALVTQAITDIRRDGPLDKVVASRCLHVGDPDPYAASTTEHAGVLARLRHRYPECTTFGISNGGETFFGATPERLVSRHRGTVRTMAVAGSIARGTDPESDLLQTTALRTSEKNQAEHRFVVDHIEAALRGLDLAPEMPLHPEVVKLRNIAHLYTPIEAAVRGDRSDVLSVAAALHPTPAVAGTPTPDAVRWIDEHERFDRGWFAAPVGWVDLAGDGELRVALRSALLDARGLHLFAGAGIVADSSPQHELAETAVKLGALVDSLTG